MHGGDIGIKAARNKSESIRQNRINNEEKRREQRKRDRAARTEALENRLSAENLQHRLAIADCENYILSGGDLDQLVQKIQAREQRRAELETALAQRGLSYRDDYILMEYVTYGMRTLEHVIAEEERKIQKQFDQEQRRRELTVRLNECGLELRSDSVLCKNFIATGHGNIDEIVTTMKEMQWYFYATNYPTIRTPGYGGYGGYRDFYDDFGFGGYRGYGGYRRYCRYDSNSDFDYSDDDYEYQERKIGFSAQKKQLAQRQFLEERIAGGNFAVSFEHDDERTRPPTSLWGPLRQNMRKIWESYAAKTTHDCIDRNQPLCDSLIKAFRNGPENVPDNIICMAIEAAIQLALHAKNIQYQGGFMDALRDLVDQQEFAKYMHERKEGFYKHIRRYSVPANNASANNGVA